MSTENPAIRAFIASIKPELAWGQALLQRDSARIHIRHIQDASRNEAELRRVNPADLRQITMENGRGQFRPLKSQPDLPSGWICICDTLADLEVALHNLYPNSVSDWFILQSSLVPPVTNYREFTGRQTGMYRVTQLLTDDQAANVIRAGCHSRNCLKQRLWTIDGLLPDPPQTKSRIPCLEPCAVLLEFARKSVRIEQEEDISLSVKPSEWESFLAAVNGMLDSGQVAQVGETSAPLNPRRLQLLLEKHNRTRNSSVHEASP